MGKDRHSAVVGDGGWYSFSGPVDKGSAEWFAEEMQVVVLGKGRV